jgi:hypothetical protein
MNHLDNQRKTTMLQSTVGSIALGFSAGGEGGTP